MIRGFVKIASYLKKVWNRFFKGTAALHKFEHNDNKIRSNRDKDFVLSTRELPFETLNIKSIVIQYNDGTLKEFDELEWHIHGNNILKNCPKIRVIINEN